MVQAEHNGEGNHTPLSGTSQKWQSATNNSSTDIALKHLGMYQNIKCGYSPGKSRPFRAAVKSLTTTQVHTKYNCTSVM